MEININIKKFSIFLKTQTFKYTTCLIPLSSPTNTPEILISQAQRQFKTMHSPGILYRTTGVILQDLVTNSVTQNDLFGGSDKLNKFDLIHKQIDFLENKFGKRLVYLASTHNALKSEKKGTNSDDLDRNLLFL